MAHYASLDAASRLDGVVLAVHRVMARAGVSGLSLRAVARENNMSPSSINQWFGSWDEALRRVAYRTGSLRAGVQRSRTYFPGVLGLLPENDAEVRFHRVWLGLVELGRGQPRVGAAVEQWLDADVAAIRSVLPAAADDLDGLVAEVGAQVDGLLAALCRPVRPMSLERAVAALGAFAKRYDLRDERAG